jgi:hypothetical protein
MATVPVPNADTLDRISESRIFTPRGRVGPIPGEPTVGPE